MRNGCWIAGTSLLLLAAILGPWTPEPVRLATERAGSVVYELHYLGAEVGDYRADTRVERDRVVFATQLSTRFAGQPTRTIEERLEFSMRAPFPLLSASRLDRSGDRQLRVDLARRPDGGYAVATQRDGVTEQGERRFHYRLADHLALELALARERPAAGAAYELHHFDLQALRPLPRRWHVVERAIDGGYRLHGGPGDEQTVIVLDRHLQPRSISFAGLFELHRNDTGALTAAAGVPPGLAATDAAFVPLPGPIADPLRLERATLRVSERVASALAGVEGLGWQSLESGYWLLTVTAERDRAADVGDAGIGKTPEIPSDHPTIVQLSRRALSAAGADADPVDALVRFVHGYLRYRHDARPLDLLDAIAMREGNCTEFANLFTAMARAAGLPARTITGLAYAEEAGPGFYLHAWNEVLVEGYWRRVDPTLGTSRITATHIPFPAGPNGFLEAVAAFSGHRIEVRELVYSES
jgi:hypothetical protein